MREEFNKILSDSEQRLAIKKTIMSCIKAVAFLAGLFGVLYCAVTYPNESLGTFLVVSSLAIIGSYIWGRYQYHLKNIRRR